MRQLFEPDFDEPFREPDERFELTEPDFFADEDRFDAAAARVLLLPLFAPLLAEEREVLFAPPRAVERDDDFEADERDVDFAADFLAPDFAVDFAADFLAPDFDVDFAADFLAPDFAVDFAADFLAPDFAADFLAPDLDVDFAADFLAPDFAVDFLAEDVELFFALDRRLLEPLFRADEVDPLLEPALLILISLTLDLSSVGIAASFKDLHVQPSRLHKATSLYQASSG